MAFARLHILGMAGSLRKGSYNRAALQAVREVLPEDMVLDVFDLAPVPFYNADLEASGVPEPVGRLRAAIDKADALLFATPEYNYALPAVLKNAIDWASRPPERAVLSGKPVAMLGASTGMMGTARAQLALRQVCVLTDMRPLNRPEVFIAHAAERFDQHGCLTDEGTRTISRQLVEALAAWTRTIAPPRA